MLSGMLIGTLLVQMVSVHGDRNWWVLGDSSGGEARPCDEVDDLNGVTPCGEHRCE
jgi:hypothetical protein